MINFKFPCNLTRNITSHSMENLAFQSFTQMTDGTTKLSLPHLNVGRMYFLHLGGERVKIDQMPTCTNTAGELCRYYENWQLWADKMYEFDRKQPNA